MPPGLRSLNCPNCGAPIDWDGKYGQPVTCPYCRSQFMPGATEVDDVWLFTDPVARARFEFEGRLDALEQDIRYEVLHSGTWRSELNLGQSLVMEQHVRKAVGEVLGQHREEQPIERGHVQGGKPL